MNLFSVHVDSQTWIGGLRREIPGMRHALRLLAAVFAIVLLEGRAAPAAEDSLEHARTVLKSTILVDGHNDLPWAIRANKDAPGDVDAYDLRGVVSGQTDLKRLR